MRHSTLKSNVMELRQLKMLVLALPIKATIVKLSYRFGSADRQSLTFITCADFYFGPLLLAVLMLPYICC